MTYLTSDILTACTASSNSTHQQLSDIVWAGEDMWALNTTAVYCPLLNSLSLIITLCAVCAEGLCNLSHLCVYHIWVQIFEGDYISWFWGHQPNIHVILAKFCEAMQEHIPSLGKRSSRMALLRYFRPTTDHWRETLCVVFLCHHLFTDPQVPSHN